MTASRLLLALAALACGAPALAAQTVQGRFVDPSGEPVPGGRAVLRDRQGRDVATAMTGRDGAFVLQAPRAGRYSLSVERIGYGLTQSPVFELANGQTLEQQVAANPQQVALQGVVVRGRSRCTPRPGTGAETATVWEEARKALRSARENESAANQYGVRRFWRQLDADGKTIVRDSVAPAEITTGSPFISAPAERLAETGFIESAGSDLLFHAPDAAVLLSSDFQNGHCFALQEGENGLIGLSFEPVRRGEKSDVQGTLWLDRASAELRRVEYRYTRVPGLREPSDAASGRMDFRRLDDGRWIVSRWAIRMPVIVAQPVAGVNLIPGVERSTRDQSQLHFQLAAQLEQGGDVVAVTTAAGGRIDLAGSALVRGMVFDSTRLQPLAGASVSVGGRGHTAVTDSLGRYTLRDVPAGEYALAFSSPRLDSMRFVPTPVPVTLREGATTEVNLAVPPLAAVWASACADSGRAAGKGVLVGRVHGASGDAQPGARVAVSWSQPGAPAGNALLTTDAQGVYRLCSAPAGPALTVRVNTSRATLTVANLRVGEAHALRQDVGLPAEAEGARAGAATAQATVSGVVRGGAGQPLAGASVRFGEGAAATTDGQGRFRIRALPPREYLVTVTHPELGTRAARVAMTADAGEVDLRPGSGESGALVASVQRVVRLAALQAQARNATLDIQGFYDRQRRGMGTFITEERLQRNTAGRLTDVLRGVPGVRVVRWVPRDTANAFQRNLGRSGTDIDEQYRIASSRGSTAILNGQGPCWMDVYLDGVQVQSSNPAMSANLDAYPLSNVQAVEVYRGPAEAPEQYKQAFSACGVVLLWTKS
ncbi:MAG TPA: carboxypeptidase regulatory-like domain-containing protein [Longimicrobium sp.]|nr:carboxypeptidase regulatory-like domain-containing protein [Longimicrobium sp.]